ncbi:uncharacterized protein SCHCODRAFT_02707139 [Schizophyllum commune H4-8]|uniref:uncharacterized protein n=1 Tax=Schizophyllum commune (strain H4-8 / FGSC 9210) TaxID=578458 RepID=UPI0021607809|nr:uncharacterized protein SCHCODRAFT_02707139 [Schizophyllum commune H4-8]KAI5884794.1 hypothetical protein SCHCODRAFT_02707139 [Schizophyllum commune H4-8]
MSTAPSPAMLRAIGAILAAGNDPEAIQRVYDEHRADLRLVMSGAAGEILQADVLAAIALTAPTNRPSDTPAPPPRVAPAAPSPLPPPAPSGPAIEGDRGADSVAPVRASAPVARPSPASSAPATTRPQAALPAAVPAPSPAPSPPPTTSPRASRLSKFRSQRAASRARASPEAPTPSTADEDVDMEPEDPPPATKAKRGKGKARAAAPPSPPPPSPPKNRAARTSARPVRKSTRRNTKGAASSRAQGEDDDEKSTGNASGDEAATVVIHASGKKAKSRAHPEKVKGSEELPTARAAINDPPCDKCRRNGFQCLKRTDTPNATRACQRCNSTKAKCSLATNASASRASPAASIASAGDGSESPPPRPLPRPASFNPTLLATLPVAMTSLATSLEQINGHLSGLGYITRLLEQANARMSLLDARLPPLSHVSSALRPPAPHQAPSRIDSRTPSARSRDDSPSSQDSRKRRRMGTETSAPAAGSAGRPSPAPPRAGSSARASSQTSAAPGGSDTGRPVVPTFRGSSAVAAARPQAHAATPRRRETPGAQAEAPSAVSDVPEDAAAGGGEEGGTAMDVDKAVQE